MKVITIPNRELRVLSNQLQNYKLGFTIAEIRTLDRVVRTMEDVLKPFEEKYATEKEKKYENNKEREAALNDFLNTVGKEEVACTLEEADFTFVKNLWLKMAGISGTAVIREAVIVIDDALNNAGEPVFTNNKN